MSKFDKLWDFVKQSKEQKIVMSFEEIEKQAGLAIDHSFLTYKKELNQFGWCVGKISLKNKTVEFLKN